DPQAERLYRPLRLVAEIFPADSGALYQLHPAGQNAVRLGLAGDHAGPLAGGFCQTRHPRRDPAKSPEGQRAQDFGYIRRRFTVGGRPEQRWWPVANHVKTAALIAALLTGTMVECAAT